MVYTPKPAPGLRDEATSPVLKDPETRRMMQELYTYIQQEFQALAREFQEMDAVELRTRHTAPAKPREGMLVMADGTNWNPGAGIGVYAYIAGAWVKL